VTRTVAELPGPPRLPLLGNAPALAGPDAHLKIEQWCDRYGPVFRFHIGPRPVLALADLEHINSVLRDRPDGFARWREIQTVFDEMGTSGVFSEEGATWRAQRRLAVTALNSNHLQRYFHVVGDATERLHRRLARAAAEGRSLDIAEELARLTVDVTSALAFGHDLNTLERGEVELQRHIQRIFEMIARRVLAPVPYWRYVRLPADRALDRSLAELNTAITGFIEQARARMRERPELHQEPENFLEAMLAAQVAEGAFTDKEIAGNVFTMLLAGEDTTAHTIAWALWLLASHPEAQGRWAQESQQTLGAERCPSAYEMIERLQYGEAVLRESMRLKPVAVFIPVESLADTVIADTRVPAKTKLWLLTRHAGLHATPDGHRFHPDRWCEEDAAPDQKTFLAFGAGPRFCPGRNLAFLESKTVMAMIARNFEIELDESAGAVSEQLAFTMIPRGLRVRLRERAQVAV